MTISQLIEYVGNEHCQIQWLHECQKRAQSRKDHTEITFGTNGISTQELAVMALDGRHPKNVGIVIWMPAERLPEEVKTKLGINPKQPTVVS